EERQSRRELDVADAVRGRSAEAFALLDVRRIALDAEQEVRRHEHRLDGGLDTAVEICTCAALVVKREQRLDVGVRARTAKRPAREIGENRPRAGRLLGPPCRPTYKDVAAARRVSAAARIVWAADDQRADLRRSPAHIEPLHSRAIQPEF